MYNYKGKKWEKYRGRSDLERGVIMDKVVINTMYQVKDFLRFFYAPIIGQGNNLENNEHIAVLEKNKQFAKEYQFNNIDDLVNWSVRNNSIYTNSYFGLNTTNSHSRRTEDILTCYGIGLDYDKKDNSKVSIDYIQNKFNELGLYYNALIDSGHGYHVYILLEPTKDIELVTRVTKRICELTGADINACKPNQLLRLPGTYNVKDESEKKKVNIVYQDANPIRKNINKLARRFDILVNKTEEKKYIILKIPKCISNIIENGSKVGNRNADLQKIVISHRMRNIPLHKVLDIANTWNSNNNQKLNQNELEYQTKYIYENVKYVELGCNTCSMQDNCWNNTASQFDFPEDHKIINLAEQTTKYLKRSSRKGKKQMNGNQILVYSILKCHSDGLFKEELEKELTYKSRKKKINRVALSNPTLIKTLKELEENKFIEVELVGRKKLYKVKETKNKIELTYNVSFAAAFECVKGNISTDELRLYNYMRYLHNKEQRENPKAIKGNILQITQRDLAKDLDITQGRISQMIDNLLDEKLISIWYRGKSQNNGFEYYVYRLNY